MTQADKPLAIPDLPAHLPNHTELPDEDGTFVKNFQEHFQSLLLTDSIVPVLDRLHPDGNYCIGQDSGIYWRLTQPPQHGAEAPDWFYVPNVPPTLNGELRRSYVMWQEIIAPLIVLEFVSGDGREERDRTPYDGKFWVYEQAIRVPFYGIYEVKRASLEVYRLFENHYHRIPPNERGHFPIPPMGVELGLWNGHYNHATLPWLRWWDDQGTLLLTGEERAEQERQRAEQERQRAEQAQSQVEQERRRSQQLAERLRALGIDPNAEDTP